ncbi:MAG: polysaccharide biosynthesis/export family protein [Prochlorococcus marinus CUG1437]|nr:polysaccharide biosynthesis/export family protein [Prochlorococcus marinus CUG1437]
MTKSVVVASTLSNKPNSEYLKKVPKNLFYILGPGDVISMQVSEDLPELDTSLSIDGEGTVSINRLNRIYVSGLTIKELTDILNVEFKKFVYEPNVKLSINQYRPVKIFISGEVENPGLHVLPGASSPAETIENFNLKEVSKNEQINNKQTNNSNLKIDQVGLSNNVFFPSVIDALRKAGGITMYSDLENIEITRKNSISDGGGRVTTNINIIDALDLKDLTQNIRVLDGDTIQVNRTNIPAIKQISKALKSNINPKFINVALAGRVESPGPLTINKSASLNDAITLAGGLKVLRGKIRFIRYENDGNIDQRKFAYKRNAPRGDFNNPYLKNGDVILVGKGVLSNTNEVLGEITSPLQGLLTTYGFYKIITD